MIMKLPPFAIEVVADIVLYHRPKNSHYYLWWTNICYGFPSGMPEWNIQIRKSSISTCMQASWKTANLKSWITRLVTSGLNWWQRTSLKLHTHLFDPNTPIPWDCICSNFWLGMHTPCLDPDPEDYISQWPKKKKARLETWWEEATSD